MTIRNLEIYRNFHGSGEQLVISCSVLRDHAVISFFGDEISIRSKGSYDGGDAATQIEFNDKNTMKPYTLLAQSGSRVDFASRNLTNGDVSHLVRIRRGWFNVTIGDVNNLYRWRFTGEESGKND